MKMEILSWERWEGHSEAGGVIVDGKLLETLVTATSVGFETDVIDGGTVIWQGILPDVTMAKVEALARARRASFRVV